MLKHWENEMLDTMWSFLQMGGLKTNYPVLKEACMELRQMMMQKTAGQRRDKPKDLSFDNLERVKTTIICEAMALVLSGEYEPKEGKVKSNPETDIMSPEDMAHYLMDFCHCHLAAGNGCPGCPFDKPTSDNGDGECRLYVPDDWDF